MSKPKIFETTFLAHPCGLEVTHEGADVEFSTNSGGPGMVVPASDEDVQAIAPYLQTAVRVTVIVEPVEGEE